MPMSADVGLLAQTGACLRAGTAIVLLAWCLAGCGGESRVYPVGEGAAERKGYERAYGEGGGEQGMGTPITAVERWGFGCRQLFKGGRSNSAALLQQPCGQNEQVFAVSEEFWSIYSRAGEEAPMKYGFPMGPPVEWMGGVTQGFGRRGAVQSFFMQRPGEPAYVLSESVLQYYVSLDDRDVLLGYPTSNQSRRADGTLCQRFERGAVQGGDAGNLFVTPPVEGCGETGYRRQ